MSMTVQVKFPVREVVRTGDKTKQDIDLRPILSPEDMKALLRAKLEEKGYTPSKDNPAILEKEETDPQTGLTVKRTVNTDNPAVETSVETEDAIDEEITARGYDDVRGSIDRSKEAETAALINRRTKEAEAKVNETISRGAAKSQQEMGQVLQEVCAEALKTRARQMGDVVEQHEGTNEHGEYELNIKVEV